MEHGAGTTKGKSCDTFAPIGPWLVTADEINDPQEQYTATAVTDGMTNLYSGTAAP